MKIIFYSNLSEIRKFEIQSVTESVVGIVLKHNPTSLYIQGMLNLLQTEMSGLSKLTVTVNNSYPQQDEAIQLRRRRDRVLQAIKSHAIAVEKAGVNDQAEHAAIVLPVINRYLKGFNSNNRGEKSEKVGQLLSLLSTAEMITALNKLGMTPYIDELKVIQTAVTANAAYRRDAIVSRTKSQTQEIKAKVLYALRNLLKAIELASIEHTDLDYTPLINELNNYLATLSGVLKARRTRRMNAVKKETAASTPTSIATAN